MSEFLFIIIVLLLLLWGYYFFSLLRLEKKIIIAFNDLDKYLYKRIYLLYKMMDIIKVYNNFEFEEFNSKLYDIIYGYKGLNINDKILINREIISDTKRVLLFSDVYPEIKSDSKYMRFEKQIKKCNKKILDKGNLYNKNVNDYYKCRNRLVGRIVTKVVLFNEFYLL